LGVPADPQAVGLSVTSPRHPLAYLGTFTTYILSLIAYIYFSGLSTSIPHAFLPAFLLKNNTYMSLYVALFTVLLF
jgi:hypothetical protein